MTTLTRPAAWTRERKAAELHEQLATVERALATGCHAPEVRQARLRLLDELRGKLEGMTC